MGISVTIDFNDSTTKILNIQSSKNDTQLLVNIA